MASAIDCEGPFRRRENITTIKGQGPGAYLSKRDRHGAGDVFFIPAIEQLPLGSPQRLQRMDDAVNALISPDATRNEFTTHQRYVHLLYDAVKPDPVVLEVAGRVSCLASLAEAIRLKRNPDGPADISHILGEINKVLDQSILGVELPGQSKLLDLSKINFEALRKRFEKAKHKNTEFEQLRAAIEAQLDKLIQLNPTRRDFADKFEEIIQAYNEGSRNIEDIFVQLLKLSRSLDEEQERHIRENLSEEELVIFDILTRPAPELTPEERAEIKKVARDLLERIKTILVLNWRQKSAARSQVKLTIEDLLDHGLPRAYTPEIYNQKVTHIFQHIYEKYPEVDSRSA